MVVMEAMMAEPDPAEEPAGAARPGGYDLCGVALAAGAGQRLRPLTRLRPKPLCPVGGRALVDLAIDRLHTVLDDVAVNVHHDREPIAAHVAGRAHVSVEDEEALGTAGALGHLRDWIDGRGVVVVNADTWCPGDLAPLVDGWDGERVRLALAGGDDRLRPTSRIAASLMPWSEVAGLAATPTGLYEVSWRRAADEGRVEVVGWEGPCLDCGTPARYLHANLAATGGAPAVEDGAEVAGDAVVERSVVWAGARVRPGEVLRDAVRADGLTVLVR
jgi:NDP-sugar pyrophosphorylase family protein